MTRNARCDQSFGLKPLLAIMAGVYTIQSLIGMFTLQGIPAVLRSEGVSTSQIGLLYLAMLPWALKFLWAPYIEKRRKQGNTFKSHGAIILLAQCLILLVLGVVALTPALQQPLLLFSAVLLLAMLSTFADICTDGLAIDRLPQTQRGIGNVMQVGGGYLGAMVGGGLFIYLTGAYNWQTATLVLMALVSIMSIPSMNLLSQPFTPSEKRLTSKPSLKSAILNPKVQQGLILVALCQLGTRGVQSMMMPFLSDKGIALEDLGLLAAGGGALTGLVGIAFSGWLLNRVSAPKMLLACLAIEAIIFSGLWMQSAQYIDLPLGVETLFVLNSFIAAVKFVALYTLMMAWSYGSQSGVDFSLFQSMDMIVAIVMAMACGWVIASFDYQTHYAITVCTTVVAALLLRYLVQPQSQPQGNAINQQAP
ncbi:MFS transporter [Vibrio ostreicida]|uniref:MFS transporter n=1 Tax=Vibrio ostreicida TaxID=526588 RepID=A0ABT8BZX5_9VIBR|nr:MFS transporter [Vibrio ostreicida]MDN3612372.1 MFS transporter [Vibrio ostreicida]NPD09857.1 MFS transporter [Vibrio ostreicida]